MTDAQYGKVLPSRVDALKLTSQGAVLEGMVSPDSLPRLKEAVARVSMSAQASLSFDRDASGHRVVSGDLKAEVEQVCQRCLLAMSRDIVAEISWVLVFAEDQREHLPQGREPWMVDEDGGDLHHMLEEELLLALPIVPFHPLDDCVGSDRYSSGAMPTADAGHEDNPFQILKQLKFDK